MRRVSRAQYNAIMARRQQMANSGEIDISQQGNISMEVLQQGEQSKANTTRVSNQASNSYPSGRQIQYAQMRQQQAPQQQQQAQAQQQQQQQAQQQQQSQAQQQQQQQAQRVNTSSSDVRTDLIEKYTNANKGKTLIEENVMEEQSKLIRTLQEEVTRLQKQVVDETERYKERIATNEKHISGLNETVFNLTDTLKVAMTKLNTLLLSREPSAYEVLNIMDINKNLKKLDDDADIANKLVSVKHVDVVSGTQEVKPHSKYDAKSLDKHDAKSETKSETKHDTSSPTEDATKEDKTTHGVTNKKTDKTKQQENNVTVIPATQETSKETTKKASKGKTMVVGEL